MFVEDSESRRFELNIWLSFSQADLGPCPGIVFFVFFGSLKLFFRRIVLIASGTASLMAGSLKFKLFFGNVAFPLSSV